MLLIAIEYRKGEVVEELLRRGADPDHCNEKVNTFTANQIDNILWYKTACCTQNGEPPLIVAANTGDTAIFQDLIEHKAKLDTTNKVYSQF